MIDAKRFSRRRLVQTPLRDHVVDGMSKVQVRLPLLRVRVAEIGEYITRAAVVASSASFTVSTFRFATGLVILLRDPQPPADQLDVELRRFDPGRRLLLNPRRRARVA